MRMDYCWTAWGSDVLVEEIVIYPERTKSTTFGRLAWDSAPACLGQDDDGAAGGDGQRQLMEVQRTRESCTQCAESSTSGCLVPSAR